MAASAASKWQWSSVRDTTAWQQQQRRVQFNVAMGDSPVESESQHHRSCCLAASQQDRRKITLYEPTKRLDSFVDSLDASREMELRS
ncbi:uncharacterized protein PITG_03007 [Phytophthora infestans T30-4]|uniref:Uncharacterized protein n=2 Tax=Phytophthora infestans TaxID=4787 RepID=D0MZ51_PHYIT|nr:uncharacterized protein PITG_03007 [Phytophthora infestans T30-4]EEY65514.1 hypothetical protein PITG_03007 [Phytophthora infestans T30-4]KAF4038896.1 hypothetical protein GN244_ATG08877 [Phytophthora infestans]KAF4143583.1 hypothetical protein GN958_ATG07316 [Phytophthora infestans]|eukprot:XP_002906113.1 hypothetical protein PITG_03007 [Phytophthora infestans T30-4]